MIQFCTFFGCLSFSKKLASFLCFLSTFPVLLHAKEIPNTTLLIGGSLHTCSSMNDRYCIDASSPFGKENALYLLSKERIESIKVNWPENTAGKDDVVAVLTQLSEILPNHVSLTALKQHWFKLSEAMYYALPDNAYYFVLDKLEVLQVDNEGNRLKEYVDTSKNRSVASNRILKVIENAAKRNENPLILSVTASSRDPYESADFYEGLLSFKGVRSRWLALTPASARALANGDCENLSAYRVAANTYQRDVVYPDRTSAEYALCAAGIESLRATLAQASVIMFNGGDQSLTRQIFFDESNRLYPWAHDILNIPFIVGTSAGTAVQSGGENQFGRIPMISNGSSIQALIAGATAKQPPSARCLEGITCLGKAHPDSLTYEPQGGFGRFNLGILDTHFSERGRTLRLFTLLKDTNQKYGFGIDETTALLVSDTSKETQFAVVGQSGVVVLEVIDDSSFYYSYWPQGVLVASRLQQEMNFEFFGGMKKVDSENLLSTQPIVNDIMNKTQLRTATQSMCRNNIHQLIGTTEHEKMRWQIEFKKDAVTDFYEPQKNTELCVIQKLKVSVTAK